MQRKRHISVIYLMLLLILSQLPIISAEYKTEDMEWSLGDKWEYRYTNVGDVTIVIKMTAEIMSDSVAEIDSVNYEVYVGEIIGEMEAIDGLPSSESYNFSFVEGSDIVEGKIYADKESGTQKTILNMTFQAKEERTDTELTYVINTVSIGRVISGEEPNVIDVGSSWVCTMKSEETTTTTVSGSYFDEYIEPGYTNTTTETESDTQIKNYECAGKKTVTTTAGTFETYEMEERQVGEQAYTLLYISPTVKRTVKEVKYDSEGSIISLIELISYDVTPVSSTASSDKTPGFEFIFPIVAIAVVLLLKQHRKR